MVETMRIRGWPSTAGRKCSPEEIARRAATRRHNLLGQRRPTGHGYVQIWTDEGLRYEHRVVMEQELGRKLARHEVVHHRNGNKTDNRPRNLLLVTPHTHNEEHGLPPGAWSRRYGACVLCGRTERKHASRGRCDRCYQRRSEMEKDGRHR